MTNNTPVQRGAPDAPLTDPADLMALMGRFFGSVILAFFSVLCLLNHRYDALIGTASGSLFLQWMAVRLWRRLRDERLAKKAALGRTAQTTASKENG